MVCAVAEGDSCDPVEGEGIVSVIGGVLQRSAPARDEILQLLKAAEIPRVRVVLPRVFVDQEVERGDMGTLGLK